MICLEPFETDQRRGRKHLPSHTAKRKSVSASAGSWNGQQVDYIAFEVEDVTALAACARKAKVPVVKALGPGAYGPTIYLSDPDGNTIELFEVIDQASMRRPRVLDS